MKKYQRTKLMVTLALVVALVAIVGVLGLLSALTAPVEAAPPYDLSATPAGVTYSNDKVNPPVVLLPANTVLTQTTTTDSYILADAELLEAHLVIDQAAVTNAITVTLEHSNDGSSYVANPTSLVAGSSADVNQAYEIYNHLWRTRARLEVAGSDPVTITHFSILARR